MTSLRRRVFEHLRRRFGDRAPSLRLVFWDGETFAFDSAPAVTITVRSPRVARSLLSGNMQALGDAYVAGDLAVEGSVDEILAAGIAIADLVGRSSMVGGISRTLALLPRIRSRRRDAQAIAHHYDVSNEFFALWLDRNMVYSCAYFRRGSEDIDTAQEQKLDHICRKLRLGRGDRLLDVGCGFGGLLRWAASNYGIAGLGVTLSEAQADYARREVARDNLTERVEIRHQHYRDIDAECVFDKVVSVGMFEHVGINQLPYYFSTLFRVLKPGGALLNHGIILTGPEGVPQGPKGGEFIERHVFPGGELAPLFHVLREIARAGFEVVDVEDLRPHYVRTLRLWVERLENRAQEAVHFAGPERYRVWRMYMAGMAHAFERGWLSVAQVLAYRPGTAGLAARPWTRDYQYAGRQ